MICVAAFTTDAGELKVLFLSDANTGNSAKDVLGIPGIYDAVLASNPGLELHLEQLSGGINSYRTKMFALVAGGKFESKDHTSYLHKVLAVPPTAVPSMLSMLSEDMRQDVSDSLDAIHFYETVKEGDKLCLSGEALSHLDPALREKMTSVRRSYVLKGTENQDIFQKSAEDTFGVALPALDAIHAGDDNAVSTLDILRIVAPYRKQEGANRFGYRAIYHTPYYKVDERLAGMVPNDMSWLSGISANDTVGIQTNEQHMRNNLYILYCADVSRFVVEMVTGVFLSTPLGSIISRLCVKRDEELTQYLCEELKEKSNDDVSCSLPLATVDTLMQGGWVGTSVAQAIKENLEIAPGYLKSLLESRPLDQRTVDCDNLQFMLSLTDEQEQEFTDLMIKMGYLSSAMHRFLVGICKKAYSVNWGHTGATLAIPGFIERSKFDSINKEVASYLLDRAMDVEPDPEKYSVLFVQAEEDDDDSFGDVLLNENVPQQDEITTGLTYYVTTDTMQKIRNNSLPYDYFSTKATAAQTTEAAVVEYWRNVNGDTNLDMFLTYAYLNTGDVYVLIDSFLKLMRWGSRKPKLLVFPEHPEIRYVFDLNKGMRTENLFITDERDLVKVNGCDYSLAGFLTSTSNSAFKGGKIIGFVLAKDYGMVKKLFLASWVDVGEIAKENTAVIGDLMLLTKLVFNEDTVIPIEDFGTSHFEFYVSDRAIQEGLRLKIQPKDLSTLALLTTSGILDSASYLKSLKNDRIITVRDRQYDTLRRYVNTLETFYAEHGTEVSMIETSMDLAALATVFLEMYASADGKQDGNTAAAQATLSKLDLGFDTAPQIEWDETPLEGKFTLIEDTAMASTIDPIQFTDRQVQGVAARARNRIVLLLLNRDGKYIFCRKNITQKEVLLIPNKNPQAAKPYSISGKSYTTIKPLMNQLLTGGKATIQGVPAVLHKSLEGFV